MNNILGDWEMDGVMNDHDISIKALAHVSQIQETDLRRYRRMSGCPQMTVFTLWRLVNAMNSLSRRKITPNDLLGVR